MEDSNRICSKLGIQYPIVQAAMNWITNADMVAAVSNAGGMGVLGPNAGQREPVDDPVEVGRRTGNEIRKIKAQTDHAFGVNLILPNEGMEGTDLYSQAILKAIFEEGVTCIVTVGQVNRPLFKEIKKQGCILIHREKNPIPKGVKKAEDAGADIVIATGYDEGGVIPERAVGTFSVIPAIVDAVSIPVLATGGINDIRGVRAALALGAEGVYIGTRFIASNECPASPIAKQEIIRAKGAELLPLRPYRSIANKAALAYWDLYKNGTSTEELSQRISKKGGLRPGMLEGNMEEGIISVNTAIDLIREIKSCDEIIRELMADFMER